MPTRQQLMDEMNRIRHDVLAMGTKVEENLERAIAALRSPDAAAAAKEVKAGDAVVDALQLKIEDQVAVLIATQQPVARDLRELVTVFKVTENLERAGDHAVHLAKAAAKLAGEPPFRQVERLERMARSGAEMVHASVAAFLAHDAEAARRVAAMDDGVDAEHKALVSEILELMRDNGGIAQRATKMIQTSGFLERLGDHMTNLCEAVVYMVEGRRQDLNE